MHVIEVRNVHSALPEGLAYLRDNGQQKGSRFGEVIESPVPVTTVYQRPRERVLFWAMRDANPFFHFMESLWMLAGRDDVEWISQFSSNIAQFSDDGKTFHGAYGMRWRGHFVRPLPEAAEIICQVQEIAAALKNNPNCRRQVLQMWDPMYDLGHSGKDLPCNLAAHFQVRQRDKARLDMTVFNRSNDVIWGAYGANAVHFSMLQEYVADKVGVEVGVYTQVSDNYHVYTKVANKMWDLAQEGRGVYGRKAENPYRDRNLEPLPIGAAGDDWDEDLEQFLSLGSSVYGYKTRFFRRVALPMLMSWEAYKDGDLPTAKDRAHAIRSTDWRKACREWLNRRR